MITDNDHFVTRYNQSCLVELLKNIKKDYPLDDEEAIGFDRESSSRQSFSEKRKQASMSPPMTEKLIEYRSLNRKKSSHGNFIELTI